MAQESKQGIACKVTLAANNVLGMGSWTISGTSVAELDDTEFGDAYQQQLLGLITGGTVEFNGHYKVDDTQGQDLLRAAFYLKSNIADLRFYVDAASYYTPNSTTAAGGGLPANAPVSYIQLTSAPAFSVDKNGLATVGFSGKIMGVMRLI